MPTTVYVVDPDPQERAWIEASLAKPVAEVVFLEEASALGASLPVEGSCLLASADADAEATLQMVRRLRADGVRIPVIVLGPHTAFRTAVDIARLEATDFLERPVSVRELRAAVRRACPELP